MIEGVSHKYPHPLHKRRKAGIYYTPVEVATLVTCWAVRNQNAAVLDPSFGGCAFLNAALQRLRFLAAVTPARQIFGADRDRAASLYIKPFIKEGAHARQFKFEDFLMLRPSHFDTTFSSIVGNPPYIKHHRLSQKQIHAARRAIGTDSPLSGQASYWAYFVLHATNFLEEDGRLALVLPGAFMHSDYASVVRRHLAQTFRRITVICLLDRLFADALESSVLLLAEEKARSSAEVRVFSSYLKDLDLEPGSLAQGRPISNASIDEPWSRTTVDRSISRSYSMMRNWNQELKSLAHIRIGIVTGANSFFILSPSTAKEKRLSGRVVHPILTRAAQLKGLEMSDSRVQSIVQSNQSCLLVQPSRKGRMSKAIRRWIQEGRQGKLEQRSKCAIRKPWYRVIEEPAPDAFLSYMSGNSPRLLLNHAGITCTNAIHRLTWKPKVSPKHVAMGFLSSVTQLSCEIEGRSYGGGVLKLEPSEAGRVLIPIIPGGIKDKDYKLVHQFCLNGEYEKATRHVDRLLVDAGLISPATIRRIHKEIHVLRSRRLSWTMHQSQ